MRRLFIILIISLSCTLSSHAQTAPTISFFSPTSSPTGSIVIITGTNFTGTTSVSFGGVAASSFTVNSATSINAIPAGGASGSISVATPGGTATAAGFTFITEPKINTFEPSFAQSGSTVTISGINFTGATAVSFGGVAAKSFTINSATNITAVVGDATSGSVSVTTPAGTATAAGFSYIYTLPVNNFKILATGESCKSSNNGSVTITAVKSMNYTAKITGTGVNKSYPFTGTLEIKDLSAGTYNVCITVDGVTEYKQCYDVVITESKDLSVYVAVNKSGNTISLTLDGGTLYKIELNGVQYTTSKNQITLSLAEGDNSLKVTTDKECQGTVERRINVAAGIRPFPNPFENVLNLDFGEKTVKKAEVQLCNLAGKLVFSKQFTNQSGKITLDVSGLEPGYYLLKLSADDSESISKVFKK